MGRSKELYMAAHEAAIERYLEQHPDADEAEAYEATTDQAYHDMGERMADMADAARMAWKDR